MGSSALESEQVLKIRRDVAAGVSKAAVALEHDITIRYVNMIVRNKVWTPGKEKFKARMREKVKAQRMPDMPRNRVDRIVEHLLKKFHQYTKMMNGPQRMVTARCLMSELSFVDDEQDTRCEGVGMPYSKELVA